MTALSAAQAGLLVRSPDGRYSEVSGEGKKPEGGDDSLTPEKTDQEEQHNPELRHDAVETALETVAQQLGSYAALDRHAISAISGLASDDFSYAAKNLASATGEEPEAATEFIQGVYDQLKDTVGRYIRSKHHGINPDEVFDWAANYLSPSEKSSLFHHVYLGRSSVLDGLVTKYQKFGIQK